MSNPRKSKKEKELDIILEQLKKSYGAESSDMSNDISDEPSEYEEDLELSSVLSKIFSEEQEISHSDTKVNSTHSDESENSPLEIEMSSPLVESEIDDSVIDTELFDENEIHDTVIDTEFFDENEIDDTVIDAELIDDNEIENLIIEPDAFNEDNETEETENSGEILTNSNDVEEEELSYEPEFAVEDEEYDVLTDLASEEEPAPTSEPEFDDRIDSINEQESEALTEEKNVLILDPAQYTYDCLQDGLPKFKSINVKTEQTPLDSDISEEVKSDEIEDFDNNDISLLLKLGYDNEIKSKVGREKTQNVILDNNRRFVPEDDQKPYGFCGEELIDRSQIPKIRQKYQSDKRSLLISLASVFILFLMTLSVTVYFDTYSSRTDSFAILILIEFILISIISAILYKKLFSGIMGMIKLVVNQYSVLSFILAVYVLYDLTALISYAVNYKTVQPSELIMFGTCIAFYALLTVASDLINCVREASAFDLMASSNNLFTAEKVSSDAVDPVHSEETTYKIRKTSLISGYFKKTSQSTAPLINLIYLLGVVPLIALIIGCTFAISSGSIINGISSATISALLCIPLSCVCIFPFNEYTVSAKLKENKIALMGYDAATEYSKIQNLTFKDCDVILITSYSEIHPQDVNGQSSLRIAYEIFNSLGGTIGKYHSSSEIGESNTKSNNIVINSISDNGIDINYALSTNILLGDKNYMRAHNIKVKTDSSLHGATKGPDRSVLYMAFDGVPKLGFIIGSHIAPEFISSAQELESCGVKVFVDSYEPYVNDLYFEQNTEERLAVEVLKPRSYDPYVYKDIRDGNVVCTSDCFDLAKIIPLSKRIVRQRKICKYINYGLMASGFILSCLLTFTISSKTDALFFEFIKAHCSLIINFILLMGLVPGAIALWKFRKDKTKSDTTTQNGDKNPK
ncbi:MAG: hypothetical protein E7577_05050 [Ruminococcaceae bacterium]|nr:hypothetical protein [Oscillospiraceae bacterium]